jgi:hypothetical protein
MATLSDHLVGLRAERNPGFGFFLRLVRLLEAIMIGRVNWVGQATLKNGNTTEVVFDPRVLETSQIDLMATSAAGGTAIQAAWISAITEQTATTQGSFTINHADPGASVTVRYSIKG